MCLSVLLTDTFEVVTGVFYAGNNV